MKRDASPPAEGLLAVDKPAGPTSHDIVARVRATLAIRRVGHAGTLDPMASGLLPLVLGRATRLVRFLPHSPKTYEGTLQLGIRTASDDITGEVIARHEGPFPDAARVREAATAMLGRSLQVPPAVSARKVGGERLYRLARRGVAVEAPPAEIEVLAFELAPEGAADRYRFVAEVSGGTYIRALARDLGETLGCLGTLASLRRTAIGPLSVAQAVAVPADGRPEPEALRSRLIPLTAIPLTPPAVTLDSEEDAVAFGQGRRLRLAAVEGPCRVLGPDGRLLGIADAAEGRLQPRVVLPE